jgi:hypothetical protein
VEEGGDDPFLGGRRGTILAWVEEEGRSLPGWKKGDDPFLGGRRGTILAWVEEERRSLPGWKKGDDPFLGGRRGTILAWVEEEGRSLPGWKMGDDPYLGGSRGTATLCLLPKVSVRVRVRISRLEDFFVFGCVSKKRTSFDRYTDLDRNKKRKKRGKTRTLECSSGKA